MLTFSFLLIETLKEAVGFYFQWWWFFTPLVLWPIFQLAWVNYIQEKYFRGIKWHILKIKISKESERRPKTMDEFFAAIYSVNDVVIDTLYDIFISGMLDAWFSFEIVSIEGDIHFYIRTPDKNIEMIEAQIYAQYPDAEIKEVEDYVTDIPDDIPSKDYELWGTDMTLGREDAYPLRTYKDYEDTASGEFIDPISNIIEGLSKLVKGEQIWMQILIRPTDDSWKKEADDLVLELIGRKDKKKKKKEEKESLSMMLHLSPGEKDVVTAIEESTKRPGFETDIRWIYLSKRDIFNKTKGNALVFSYLAQFGSQDLNYLIPDSKTKTSAYYFLADYRKALRKRAILRKYKRREFDKKGYVLN